MRRVRFKRKRKVEGRGRGKGEEDGKGKREIGSEALAETEKIAKAPAGNQIEPGTQANAPDALPLSHRDKRHHQPVWNSICALPPLHSFVVPRPSRESNRGPQQTQLMLYHWATKTSDITSQFVWNFIRSASTSQVAQWYSINRVCWGPGFDSCYESESEYIENCIWTGSSSPVEDKRTLRGRTRSRRMTRKAESCSGRI